MKIHGILGTKGIMRRDSISNFAVCFYGFFVQSTAGCFYKPKKLNLMGGFSFGAGRTAPVCLYSRSWSCWLFWRQQ